MALPQLPEPIMATFCFLEEEEEEDDAAAEELLMFAPAAADGCGGGVEVEKWRAWVGAGER